MKVVTASDMRDLEKKADAFGLSSVVLMQLAGVAVAEETANSMGGAQGRRALILVGPGNNGGDGLVAASYLHDRGADVTLYLVNRKLEGDQNYALCHLRCIGSVDVAADTGFVKLEALLLSADVVVDALLGIGLGRPITGALKGVLDAVESARRARLCPPGQRPRPYLVSLDIPTGLNSDTGEVDQSCFSADLTVTLGFPKLGMFLFPGAARVGKLVTRSIGIPSDLAAEVATRLLSAAYVSKLLPPRPLHAHKGTFGKVLVVGGSPNYVGAPCLASLAALRVGAGLVTLAVGHGLHSIVAAKLTETTFLPLPEVEEGVLGAAAVPVVAAALGDYDAVLIGCGLGRHPETAEFVRKTLKACPPQVKVVVDADGLNVLAETDRWWDEVRVPLVLTPHPGEMARMTGCSVGEVNARRFDVARQWSARWGKVVVLKGAYTVIAEPGGDLNINPSANPALAVAGVGDVLSGMIAGLLAQGLSLFDGATAAAFVHGQAGEAVRRKLGDSGLQASGLANAVPEALRAIRASP